MPTRPSRQKPGAKPRERSREDPKAAERKRILDAAERVFAEHGFAGARMQDIASTAKVSLRSVYAVSNGKAQILRTLMELRAEDLVSRVAEVLSDDSRDPADSLMDVIATVVTFLVDRPDFLRIQLQEGRAWALAHAEHPLAGQRRASDKLLERLFRRGIRAGTFHDDGPRLMVASLRALEQVQLAAWVSSGGRVSKRAVIESIQRQARRLFCR